MSSRWLGRSIAHTYERVGSFFDTLMREVDLGARRPAVGKAATLVAAE